MSFLESIVYMMWRGVAIGLIISAPMGPVGILCIQRTLDKGRKAGFYTGVGAALSDLFYCLLTGFGLSFIEEFLERNSAVIQLVGSLVLVVFGIYLFKKNPARQLKRPSDQVVSTKKSILAGFLFTFSNPLILFLIIGLFARFNFLMPEIRFYHYFVGYIFIMAGALGWWWLVTFFIDKVRTHFNLRSMWLINKIIGVVILIFALVGIVTGVMDLCNGGKARAADKGSPPRICVNPSRGYDAIGGDSLLLPGSRTALAMNAGSSPFSMRLIVNPSGKPWSLEMKTPDPDNSLRLEFCREEIDDGVSSSDGLVCTAFRRGNVVGKAAIPFGVSLSPSENLMIFNRKDSRLLISAGSRRQNALMELQLDAFEPDSLILIPRRNCRLSLIACQLECDDSQTLSGLYAWTDIDLLHEYLDRSLDPNEGYWAYLDSSVDTDLLRLGGEYMLASVRSADGYDLIYLDGARIHSGQWTPGRVKAHLSPSGIPGVWDAGWLDASGNVMSRNVRAQSDRNSVITFYFPFQNSQVRFHRTTPINK